MNCMKIRPTKGHRGTILYYNRNGYIMYLTIEGRKNICHDKKDGDKTKGAVWRLKVLIVWLNTFFVD